MDRREAIERLEALRHSTSAFVDSDFAIDMMEALDLAIEALREPTLMRCKDCRHNRNCDIQWAANAAENFGCMVGERKE